MHSTILDPIANFGIFREVRYNALIAVKDNEQFAKFFDSCIARAFLALRKPFNDKREGALRKALIQEFVTLVNGI